MYVDFYIYFQCALIAHMQYFLKTFYSFEMRKKEVLSYIYCYLTHSHMAHIVANKKFIH